MSKTPKTLPAKLGFWRRLTLTIQAIEKTETEHMWDEIEKLKSLQSELRKELHECA